MIAFGVAIASEEKYRQMALPGIERVAEHDSVVLERRGHRSIQRPYNEMLDEVAGRDDLEALVLLHEDTEICDPDFCRKVRAAFALPDVGLAGVIGARNVDSIAWWRHGPRFGRVDAPNVGAARVCRGEFDVGSHEVDAIDGLMLIVAPWAARRIRFDERFAPVFHGYDVDYSFQVRAEGGRCVVAPIDAIHYGTWKREQNERWSQALLMWERKWGVRRSVAAAGAFAWS